MTVTTGRTQRRASTAHENNAQRKAKATVKSISINNISTSQVYHDTLHAKAIQNGTCKRNQCLTSFQQAGKSDLDSIIHLKDEAKNFLDEYYASINMLDSIEHVDRVETVLSNISLGVDYELTSDELVFGARSAWRNLPTSLARVDWKTLKVFDNRDVTSASEMFSALCKQISYAIAESTIRPAMSVFPEQKTGEKSAAYRIWNPKLLAYAGYELDNGSVIGDPENIRFTQICEELGWKGSRSAYDVLPLVVNVAGEDPRWFSWPEEIVLKIKLQHPSFPWIASLGLEFLAVNSPSDHKLNIGGINFPAAPLIHGCIGSDIGSRMLARGNSLLQKIAEHMQLDTSTPLSLWQEAAVVELNSAILFSFQKSNVSVDSHHSASKKFIKFFEEELQIRGGCPSDWRRLVPTLSSAIMLIYHQEMLQYQLTPCLVEQTAAWKEHKWIDAAKNQFGKKQGRQISFKTIARCVTWMVRPVMKRVRATILYASETGRSESYAEKLAMIFSSAFRVQLVCMRDYNLNLLTQEDLILVVASTFGNGGAPENGKKFHRQMKKICSTEIKDIINGDDYIIPSTKFAVFALGSTAYPDFCEFGHFCQNSLINLGAQQILPLTTADEQKGQDKIFSTWASKVLPAACSVFNISEPEIPKALSLSAWKSQDYRLLELESAIIEPNLCTALSQIHKQSVSSCKLLDRQDLQDSQSSRKTILVRVSQGKCDGHEPGDHVAVFPANSETMVESLIKRLGCSATKNKIVLVQKTSGNDEFSNVSRLPPCSLEYAFKHLLDISSAPQQQLLGDLVQFAVSEGDKKQLQTLSIDDEKYDDWKSAEWPTLLDVLNKFPSLQPDPAYLLINLPLLQPRLYSISNSQKHSPNEIHMTVGVLTMRGLTVGSLNRGLCSNYLNGLALGSDLPCFIKRATHFYIPSTLEMPVILVGTGTGIAPYRSFWQQREMTIPKAESTIEKTEITSRDFWRQKDMQASTEDYRKLKNDKSGPMTLYFGCRHPNLDSLYQDELKQLVRKGVLSNLRTAYSRSNPLKKTYVQNLLQQDGKMIWKQLNEGAHVFICGDSIMAADVRATLHGITQTYGNMSDKEAQQFLNNMKDAERLHEDIFGTGGRARR